MTLDELISEGKTFEVKRSEPNMYYQNGFNVIQQPVSYIEHGDKYLLWVENCKRFLIINYKDDIAYDSFETATKELPKSSTDIYRLVAILESLKSLPTKCIHKKNTLESSEKLVVNVNQSQNINIDIILYAIKEEIGKNGIQSLKDISGETKEEIKKGVIARLKDFGENTLSNIVASILTNPAIWSQL